MSSYSFEQIGNGVEVCVSKSHTFGTDSFLLADFARPKSKESAVDLGTGCGIIPLLWLRRAAPATAVGLDIQPEAIEQLNISIQRSRLDSRLTPLLGDLKEIRRYLPAGRTDLVTCNPPYSTAGSGLKSPTDSRLIARHETLCTMDDVCAAAAWLLRSGGRFCLCQLPERLVDVLTSMREHQVEPKRIQFVQQESHSVPWLILVEGKRNSKPFMTVESPLILQENGRPTVDYKRIYEMYGRL